MKIENNTISTASFEGKLLVRIRGLLGLNQADMATFISKATKAKICLRYLSAFETGSHEYASEESIRIMTRWVLDNFKLFEGAECEN